ncbi:NAD(P)/FAD-dependent oxidoreductase [Halorussus sp. MSC15.2]|uniref:NAD(P)/FAD-dependent oxidoreductase n=1 Tax=Halorussus sp. MSC15.2 TaxID=2283638 RepID=UPI0013D06F95|nr:NAD(P)/FAD-dependent oxidoreductase [Halorussus sp. MSC15.2]NEU55885.1 NAD(P)/FAD-dependent oxidoreductase [Halorussus sp. MSC15.2]
MKGVVGGGIAGLAAAYRLQQHGHDVQVFEASDQIGGLAAVYETKGDPIEKFYHHLSATEETIVDLIEELELEDDLQWPIGKNAYYTDGTVYPMDKPWEILAFPPLSVYDKFRLGMLTLDVDVRGGVPKFDTYESLETFDDQSVKEFAIDHTTRNVYESFFDPLLDGKFGDRKEDVSAAWLLGRIKFRGERDILRGEPLGYLEGGFGRLLDALVEAVGEENITTNARVTDLDLEDGAVSEMTVDVADAPAAAEGPEAEAEADGGATTETHDVDDVVVAAMPNVLEDLCGYECDIDFQGAVCALITMDEPLTDTYWLNIGDDAPFGALVEHTNYMPPENYGGDHLLYVASYIQDYEEDLWQMDEDEVEDLWLGHVEEMFPEWDRSHVKEFRLAKNPRAAPIYERGYLDMVIPYDLSADVADGLYYAGMASRAQYPERSLNGGIVAGYECADRIAGRKEVVRPE